MHPMMALLTLLFALRLQGSYLQLMLLLMLVQIYYLKYEEPIG